ncbi:MAG TPA: TetR/AcrR family transcriptional regulator [Hyphomicrobiaceae bacterium]|nr:TetR/AcrR family transcriptional regulator [Hyphomicrobiaceae bacterium]
MPRLKPDTQRARREHILDAAERCFARAGFHATTMQHICREAGVSPGAFYVYFDSKEALIAGISERSRAELTERLIELGQAPDFIDALRMLGEKYFIDEPAHKRLMCVEIGIEATRNRRVGEIFKETDSFVADSFERLFRRLKDDGRIAPELDIATLAKVFLIIGDGMFWRRAVDPEFEPKSVMPAIAAVLAGLISPVPQMATAANKEMAP